MTNMDRLICLMVGESGLEDYKSKKLPDQVFADLLAWIDMRTIDIQHARSTLIKVTAEHLRAQLGDESDQADKNRMFCAQLSIVNNLLLIAQERGHRVEM